MELYGDEDDDDEEEDVQEAQPDVDTESIVDGMADEMDLLDRLALQGRPPPYPTTTTSTRNRSSNDMFMIPPTRSLSPTTVSATSQATTTYASGGGRAIVGSPTTCSQTTMQAGNLRYDSNRTSRFPIKKGMKSMIPRRFNSTNNDASIRTAYTPDSFDEEILGINSDDSHNCNDTSSLAPADVSNYMTVTDERQQYQPRHLSQEPQQQHPPPRTSATTATTATYPDVLDDHRSFNEHDDDDCIGGALDNDVVSIRSADNSTTLKTTTNAVQRHLQMS
jgi:hypothetical protein